jgi:hypothetical protein
VLVSTSPRGGSSFFAELVRHCTDFVHFTGEVTPFLRIAELTYPHTSSGSDALGPGDATGRGREILDHELALDAGWPAHDDSIDPASWALDLAWRLSVQWPGIEVDPDEVVRWFAEELDRLQQSGHGFHDVGGRREFQLRILAHARAALGPAVSPYSYDIEPALVRRHFPAVDTPEGPATELVYEVAPYLVFRPWHHATPQELRSKPLMIKSSANSYRLPFYRALFPHARLRVLHLVRNPAASINGLIDGWLYRAFFTWPVHISLRIGGYSDVLPEWARKRWNFDLPPGWEGWTERNLEEVCAFQWLEGHRATLDFIEHYRIDSHRLRFEDFVRSRRDRLRCVEELADWLGVPYASMRPLAELDVGPVMATQAPKPARWRSRAPQLVGIVERADVVDMAQRLGYVSSWSTWT